MMTENVCPGRWMTVWRLDTGAKSDSERHESRWWKQRYNRAISPRKAKKCKSTKALKEAYEELKEMYGERGHDFRSDPHRQETAPIRYLPFDQRGRSIGRRDERQKKENAQDTRNFLKQCKKEVPRAKLHVWSGL